MMSAVAAEPNVLSPLHTSNLKNTDMPTEDVLSAKKDQSYREELPPFYLMSLNLKRRAMEKHVQEDLGLSLKKMDLGYMVHCTIASLFGKMAPKPFEIKGERGGEVQIMGYAPEPIEELKRKAREEMAFGDAFGPTRAVNWQEAMSMDMPKNWKRGQHLHFVLTACAIVRRSSGGSNSWGETWQKGQEMDAYRAARQKEASKKEADNLIRQDVYIDWLEHQFNVRGGAKLVNRVKVENFNIPKLYRRTQGKSREERVFRRPVVEFAGELEITDPYDFHRVLSSGIGGHKTFGFGLMKVRRAS